ncbi:FAD dependent oxidoreductase-domain-containing protein [Cladochytrium replicatum]|nr:FAD dependent oxidoreductase-domain-containing protein [Cladochytrium replicatum]
MPSRTASRLRSFAKYSAATAAVGATIYAVSGAFSTPPDHRATHGPPHPGRRFFARSPLLTEASAASADAQFLGGTDPPSRKQLIERLKASTEENPFDLLVIGAGATGAGCAVDAATRGLSVSMVERDDFASGTSSRSTKLVHGGVRYLQKAIMELDYEQFKLVTEALHERAYFLKTAPYLSYQLPIMLPVYQLWKIPYYWAGCKAYDVLAGAESLSHSYFLSKRKALESFPMLKKDQLVGAIVYYDGAHNDSRMNVSLALTAVEHGAAVANHVEVTELIKDSAGNVKGAIVKDKMGGESFKVHAKGVVNATGPFTDHIRQMDEGTESKGIVAPSAGVHIILPSYFSPRHMGLLDPATSDGRVIYFLPWQGNVIVGTTDSPTKVTYDPMPTEEDISWILKEVENYLAPEIKVRRGDVLAAWSGIRPLVRDPAAKNTAALVRNHMINVSKSKLLTIAGGKWTTYRAMAEETVDKAIEVFDLKPKGPCVTRTMPLVGTEGWSKNLFIRLVQTYGLDPEVAEHLTDSYGDRAWHVAANAEPTGVSWPLHGKRLSPGYPYIEAEVRHAVRREYAMTAVDVLSRRMRLAFLDSGAALQALPRVVEIMGEELNWTRERKRGEYETACGFLETMGLHWSQIAAAEPDAPATTKGSEGWVSLRRESWDEAVAGLRRSLFTVEEMERFRAEFGRLEKPAKIEGGVGGAKKRIGVVGPKEVGRLLGVVLAELPAKEEFEGILNKAGLKNKNELEFNDVLEIAASIKEERSRKRQIELVNEFGGSRDGFSTVRSGGGV